MREDQRKRLKQLSENLVEVVLVEADPTQWSGGEKLPKDLTKEERGDRYWCKRNAAATMSIVMKAEALLAHYQDPGKKPPSEDDLDDEIGNAEKEAEQRLRGIQQSTGRRPTH